jgi:hypothetical protein
MKVGVLRDSLEQEISKNLYEVNLNRELSNKILKRLIEKGFLAGHSQQIIAGNIGLELLDNLKLGIIADSFYKEIHDPNLNPELYYEEETVEKIRRTKLEVIEEDMKLPVMFKNMQQYSYDMWVGTISLQKYVKMCQSGIATYNFETQRDPAFKKYKDNVIKRININPKSVIEMKDMMLNDTYLYDDVTLNILSDGSEKFGFRKIMDNVGDLIFEDGILNLTDGAHRLKAAESALLVNPNLDKKFILVITNFDVNRANDYIRQKDKRNPINREYLETKDVTNLSNDVVRGINESSICDIKGKIVSDEFLLRETEGLTLFSTMAKTIDNLWELETRRDVRELTNYLVDFFNELVGLYPNELKNDITASKRDSFINHKNMFIYYLVIAKEIQDKYNWEEILSNILSETDFTNNNRLWDKTIKRISESTLSTRLTSVISTFKNNILRRVV